VLGDLFNIYLLNAGDLSRRIVFDGLSILVLPAFTRNSETGWELVLSSVLSISSFTAPTMVTAGLWVSIVLVSKVSSSFGCSV